MEHTVYSASRSKSGDISRFLEDTDGLLNFGPLVEAGHYHHHGSTNTVRSHCVHTAWCAYRLCRTFHLSEDHESAAVQAALLHDLFGYDWQEDPDGKKSVFNPRVLHHIVYHGSEAVDFLDGKVSLNERQKDAIKKHMFPAYPVPPCYCEGWVVTLADKIVAVSDYWSNASIKCRSYMPHSRRPVAY